MNNESSSDTFLVRNSCSYQTTVKNFQYEEFLLEESNKRFWMEKTPQNWKVSKNETFFCKNRW